MSKVIVCGSRECPEESNQLFFQLDKLLLEEGTYDCNVDQVVSGMARGADTLAINYAKARKVPLIEMPANWDKHGKSAGYIRNVEMLNLPFVELVIALWDGRSKGTLHTINEATKRGIDTHIIYYEKYLEE